MSTGTHRSLVRGWGVTMGRYVGVGLLGFVWTVAVTRSLPTDQAGIVLLVGSFPALLVPIADMGLPLAIAYLVAGERVQREEIKTWIAWVVRWAILGGMLLIGAAAITGRLFDAAPVTEQVVLGLAAVPFSVGIAFFASYYRGTRDFSTHARLTMAPYVLLAVFTSFAGVIGFTNSTVFVYVVVGSYLIPCTFVAVRFQSTILLSRRDVKRIFLSAWRYSWRLYLSESAAAVRGRIDFVMVAGFLGTAALAVYGTAAIVGTYLAIVSQAAHLVVFPYVAKNVSDGDPNTEITGLVARLALASTLITVAAVLVLGPEGFDFIFGDGFSSSWGIFAAYAPGVVGLSAARVITADLMARGEVNVVMKISLTTTGLGIVLLVAGIGFAGVIGAAIATSITAIVNTSWRVAVLHRLTRVRARSLLALKWSDLSILRAAFARKS